MKRMVSSLTATQVLGLLAIASVGLLGGCVVETADEEEAPVAQASAADTYVPAVPKNPGGVKGGTPSPPVVPSTQSPSTGGTPAPTNPGTPQGSDPEPSPWKDPRSP
jgi:hypothetical protein